MADAELILTFNEDGTVHKETTGFVGTECESRTKFIDEALKGKRKNFRRKVALGHGSTVKPKRSIKLGGN